MAAIQVHWRLRQEDWTLAKLLERLFQKTNTTVEASRQVNKL